MKKPQLSLEGEKTKRKAERKKSRLPANRDKEGGDDGSRYGGEKVLKAEVEEDLKTGRDGPGP